MPGATGADWKRAGYSRPFVNPIGLPSRTEIVHAPLVVSMDEFGPTAIRKKREASISVAMSCAVSAGNTPGGVAARHFVGVLPGLKRPALAVSFPTKDGRSILPDAGAHPRSRALRLARSAVRAHIYLMVGRGMDKPSVCLLNIGNEPARGAPGPLSGRSTLGSAVEPAFRIAQDRICEKMSDLQSVQSASPVGFRHFSAMVFFENFPNGWSAAPEQREELSRRTGAKTAEEDFLRFIGGIAQLDIG